MQAKANSNTAWPDNSVGKQHKNKELVSFQHKNKTFLCYFPRAAPAKKRPTRSFRIGFTSASAGLPADMHPSLRLHAPHLHAVGPAHRAVVAHIAVGQFIGQPEAERRRHGATAPAGPIISHPRLHLPCA